MLSFKFWRTDILDDLYLISSNNIDTNQNDDVFLQEGASGDFSELDDRPGHFHGAHLLERVGRVQDVRGRKKCKKGVP